MEDEEDKRKIVGRVRRVEEEQRRKETDKEIESRKK